MNKKILIISGAVIGLLLIVGAVKLIITSVSPRGTVSIKVFPADAEVSVDKQAQVSPGDLRLAPGTHTLVITRDGFADKTITVTVTKDQTVKQSVTLDVTDPVGQAYVDKQAAQNATAQDSAPAENDTPTQTDQLAKLLPYSGSDFDIDFSTDQVNPGDASTITIEIISSTDDGNTHALNWIKAQGFDPTKVNYLIKGE